MLCHSEHIAWRGVGPQRSNIDGNSLEEQKELCDTSQVLARSGCEALCEVLEGHDSVADIAHKRPIFVSRRLDAES